MAVLNPILSLVEQGTELEKVTLLTTTFDKSRQVAKAIVSFLVQKGFFQRDSIRVIPVSDSLEDKDGLHPAHTYINEISKKSPQMVFNIAGGFNFQIAACLYYIGSPSFDIIYPEEHFIHRFTIKDDKVMNHTSIGLPKPINIVDLLDLQGVKYRLVKKKYENASACLNECQSLFSEGVGPLIINRIKFDYVWNEGNNPMFLKFMLTRNYKKNAGSKDKLLDEVRTLIAFAATRTLSGELFHRNIIIITDNDNIQERIEKESRGKITVKKRLDEIKRKDNAIPLDMELSLPQPLTFKTDSPSNGKGTLYLVLGKDILPGLISIWSHRPEKVICFYTPGTREIEKNKDAIIAHKNLLPVEDITFWPCSIVGSSICDFPVDGKEADQYVNITPGTKSQTAFLTLLAKKNNMRVFSLNTQEQRLTELNLKYGPCLSSPEPLSMLLLSGQNIHERGYGITAEEILKDKDLYEGILYFFKTIEDRQNTGSILTNGITSPQGILSVFSDKQEMEIRFLNGERLVWSSKKNEWFENLIGYVMLKQGANDVRIRMLTVRGDENISLTEIDVVVRFGATYFVISCKAGKSPVERAAYEIAAVARLFGRFAIPLLVRLQFIEEPKIINGVYVIGFPTFSREERMKMALEDARLNPATRKAEGDIT